MPNMKLYKSGDVVKCVNDTMQLYLTRGNKYEVLDFDGYKVKIANDKNTVGWYLKGRFEKA